MSNTTLRGIATAEPPSTGDADMCQLTIGLTILCHPDLGRVGEVAPLVDIGTGALAEVSRVAPTFRAVETGKETAVLGTPYLSRTALTVEALREGGVLLRAPPNATKTTANDVPLYGTASFSEQDLRRGVVLELAKTVALLLHPLSPTFLRPSPVDGLVGESAALWQLVREIRSVADTDVPVLLRGETGVGKELVARAVHEGGSRRGRPYVCVNMAAIQPNTAASALFGHKRGAFTDASADHRGYFQQAEGGTLFLDEIADTPAPVQAQLLRAAEGEVQVLGEARPRRVDVRLIGATDADIEDAERHGAFRVQLHQRLSGYELTVPPLRDRRDDVARLLVYFLRSELAKLNCERLLGAPRPGERPWLGSSVVAKLCRHHWPGNVRQLWNVARKLAIANRERSEARLDPALKGSRDATEPGLTGSPAATGTLTGQAEGPRKDAREISDDEIIAALREHRFNASRTALALGASRTWLSTRMDLCSRIRKGRDIDANELRAALAECDGDLQAMVERLEVSDHALKQRMTELGIDRR